MTTKKKIHQTHTHAGFYLKIREVFRHESIDLTDRQTSCSAALQRHEDQDAADTRRGGAISL